MSRLGFESLLELCTLRRIGSSTLHRDHPLRGLTRKLQIRHLGPVDIAYELGLESQLQRLLQEDHSRRPIHLEDCVLRLQSLELCDLGPEVRPILHDRHLDQDRAAIRCELLYKAILDPDAVVVVGVHYSNFFRPQPLNDLRLLNPLVPVIAPGLESVVAAL